MRPLLVAFAVVTCLAPPAPADPGAPEGAVHEFRVRGMTCALCARGIEKALRGVDGVLEVRVDRDAERVRVVARAEVPEDVLVAAIERAGAYEAEPVDEGAERGARR